MIGLGTIINIVSIAVAGLAGILGDYSTLAVESVLDFIIVAIMSCSMGVIGSLKYRYPPDSARSPGR